MGGAGEEVLDGAEEAVVVGAGTELVSGEGEEVDCDMYSWGAYSSSCSRARSMLGWVDWAQAYSHSLVEGPSVFAGRTDDHGHQVI